jgi:hypothetical protein
VRLVLYSSRLFTESGVARIQFSALTRLVVFLIIFPIHIDSIVSRLGLEISLIAIRPGIQFCLIVTNNFSNQDRFSNESILIRVFP